MYTCSDYGLFSHASSYLACIYVYLKCICYLISSTFCYIVKAIIKSNQCIPYFMYISYLFHFSISKKMCKWHRIRDAGRLNRKITLIQKVTKFELHSGSFNDTIVERVIMWQAPSYSLRAIGLKIISSTTQDGTAWFFLSWKYIQKR